MEGDIPKEDHKWVLQNVCPDCYGELKDGPCGGLSINKECLQCGARFNDMIMASERIDGRGK